jgi:hypothetical protein
VESNSSDNKKLDGGSKESLGSFFINLACGTVVDMTKMTVVWLMGSLLMLREDANCPYYITAGSRATHTVLLANDSLW